ncbi:hypothetical protein [Lentibacillus sp. CBA3610]|uniref:hypothetical protein n=1 Tax=Lentibacillus sp. CBA3610 TaxID=2518176 RepID=UPI00159551A0|nr:hypothetical protein [Lentibacillus sp. CBA3610]QKY71258.1 hypothetical protein Len3610_18410 [Lentibacillus sp. CBA3610]
MKLIDKIQERYKERNKVFLTLDILFTLLSMGVAIWMLFLAIPALTGSSQSTHFLVILTIVMTIFLGMTYGIRVIEMIVTGKREYFALMLFVTILMFGIATFEWWLLV